MSIRPIEFHENHEAVGQKRPAAAVDEQLPSLTRAEIPHLPRVRARKYLKSMGATQFGEPAVLRDRLGALFTTNRIGVYVPGTTRIEITP
jgi:hypothetical protein